MLGLCLVACIIFRLCVSVLCVYFDACARVCASICVCECV